MIKITKQRQFHEGYFHTPWFLLSLWSMLSSRHGSYKKDYRRPLVHKSKMTFFAKCSILNFWQVSEYPFEHPPNILQMQVNFSFTLKPRNSHLISLLSLFVATINIIAFTISFCLFCIVIFLSKFEAFFCLCSFPWNYKT